MLEKRSSEDTKIIPYDRRRLGTSEPVFEAPVGLETPIAAPQPSLGAYWHILLRRRWTILSVVAILTTLGAIASFRMKPIYRSTASVEVDSETPQIQTLNDSYQQMPMDQDFLRTQIQVLKTDSLAWRTIEQLRLGENPSFALPEKAGQNDSNYAERRKMRLIRRFRNDLAVELVPGSRVVQVSFESQDPALAARVSNTLVDNYLDYNFREKYDATRQASGRMEEQLDELKAKVEKSQQELVDYQRKHAIVDVNDKQSVVEQRLGELSTQLTTAQSDRIQKEALFTQVQSNPDKVASLAQNELLQKLEEQQAGLKKEYVEALAQYGPAFPKVVRLQKQVDEYQSLIDKERNQVVDRLRRDYASSVTRESLLTQAVSRQKTELGEFNKLLVEQNILRGDFETNQKLYERLLEHLKDATVSAGLKSTNIHLVDSALVPSDPVRPKKLLNIALALLSGLILGVSLAFVQESFDHSIKGPEEVEALLSVPALAVIPAKRTLGRQQVQQLGNGKTKSKPFARTNGNLVLEVLNHTTSALTESFRALRTATLLSVPIRPPQTILVTSSNAGEGKTTTAVNLALAFAQQQGEVLLIDCDLRKPGVARALSLENERGLSNVLAGRDPLESSLQRFEGLPNLSALTSGPLPPNPAELLSSARMAEILGELQRRFRHIVIDSPPLLMVTDGTILSTLADGVILVVESGLTPRKAVMRSCRVLQSAGAKILGVALNKVDLRYDGYYGPYYYGGYYGNGDGKKPSRSES
jgi:succinoglycan biosynthesis transport protein ExoP